MAIPASGFCLSTVKNEFTTARYGQEKMTCFLHWASQNTISVGNMSGCKLTQFANKKRTAVGNEYAEGGLFFDTGCFYAEACITDTGDDMRTSNSTQADAYISYCVTKRCGQNGVETLDFNGSCSIITPTSPQKMCAYIGVSNPYPGSGNAYSKLYMCGYGFNGFGDVTGSQINVDIQWLDSG